MNKPTLLLRSILLFVSLLTCSLNYLSAQTYIGSSSTPADNAAQAGPTVSVNPASVGTMQAGDLVIIYAQYRANSAAISINVSGGQTWNTATTYTPAGSNQTISIFWCRFNGTWGANPSVTVGAGNTLGLTTVMYVFRPGTSSSLWGVNVNPANSTSSALTNSITGVTTTASNTVTMAFWSVAATNTWNTLSGTGWSKASLPAQYRNTTAGQSHTSAYYLQTTTTGATGNVSQVQSAGTSALRTIMSWYEYPPNDNCANATLLTTSGTCVPGTNSLTAETLNGASADGGTITSNCTAVNNPDVWYKFVAQTKYPIITLSNLGGGWTTRLKIHLLSGSCGSFTEVGCGNNTLPANSFPLMPTGNGLTIGNTYYIRIQKSNAGTPTGGADAWAFDICVTDPAGTTSSRMNEVFKQTILSGPNLLLDPWEITYGPDDNLWITESKGYKVYRMDPLTGVKQTVLDISQGSTFLPVADRVFNCQFANGSGVQGGLAGLALHPKFLDPTAPVNYAYVSYVYKQDSASVLNSSCTFWKNRVVRFTFNTTTQKFESPVSLCDTLPGGNDHNSQRMIIAPVGGTYYLFYAQGDLGAGQLSCRDRVQKAQDINSYEGKILRFNLDTDNDNGTLANLSNWVPNDNPYNAMLGKQSAVWATGIRNNQGFAYDTALNILYGSSHGPYSDDEINIIEPFRNYGHPLVIGYASDGNYNGTTTTSTNTSVSAGVPFTDNSGNSANPPIGNEMSNKAAIDAAGKGLYKDPLFSAYAAPNGDINTPGTIKYIWKNNPGNANPAPGWPSEAWSGLDLYSHTLIPGWKKSLVAASLKWGRLVRIRLGTSGTITMPSNDPINNASDTISYFGSQNRFRDIAFSPDGKDIYVVMDRSTTTSGPSAQWPVIPTCAGCVQKYTFLGYNSDGNGKSTISTSIDVAAGTDNSCQNGTTVTIDGTNNNLWVPITGQDGNILAEIKANGNNLGTVTSSFYTNTGTVRETSAKKLYANRNITITPQTQPSSAVSIRLYLTATEYNALRTATNSQGSPSGISAISDLIILKNTDACSPSFSSASLTITPQYAEAFGSNYVLQANITSFSSFYFAGLNATTLPAQLLTFTGSLQNNDALLKWQTTSETNTSVFIVERSMEGNNYSAIGNVAAKGSSSVTTAYSFTDGNIVSQASTIVYYRLKTVDKNGQYSYSRVISIILNRNINVFLFPNPVKQILNVRLSSSANPIHIQITDLTGRVVYSEKHLGNQNSISIDVKQWKPQVYILKVINSKNEILTTRKFEKM